MASVEVSEQMVQKLRGKNEFTVLVTLKQDHLNSGVILSIHHSEHRYDELTFNFCICLKCVSLEIEKGYLDHLRCIFLQRETELEPKMSHGVIVGLATGSTGRNPAGPVALWAS